MPRILYTIERASDRFVVDCDIDETIAWQVAITLADKGESVLVVAHTLH